MRASVMLEKGRKKFACILAFDVPVSREAQEMADSMGVRVFTADIIYHLFDQFTAYLKQARLPPLTRPSWALLACAAHAGMQASAPACSRALSCDVVGQLPLEVHLVPPIRQQGPHSLSGSPRLGPRCWARDQGSQARPVAVAAP